MTHGKKKQKEHERLAKYELFLENDHDNAMHDLRVAARTLKKGDTLSVSGPVPKVLEKWLRQLCKKRGVFLAMHGKRFAYRITTVEDKAREKAASDRQSEFWTDYFNSPG